MRFEDYLDRETRHSVEWVNYKRICRARRETREMRKMRVRYRNMFLIVLNLWLLTGIVVLMTQCGTEQSVKDAIHQIEDDAVIVDPDPAPPETPQNEAVALALAGIPEPEAHPEEPIPEPVEEPAVVAEPVYYDVKLSRDLQDVLRRVCEETGVAFELALSVIWKETNFRNIMGDGGKSYGYMQVQPKWHSGRMEKLGVDDLMDPESNFRVGCDFLAELLNRYPLASALAYYNSGSPRVNRYAEKVMTYMEELV